MLLRRLREPDRPRKTWKEVVDNDVNDIIHLKPSDAVY